MSRVDSIKQAIEALPDDDFAELRKWFSEKDWAKWDRQIEMDSRAGKLDFLAEEALNEKSDKELRDL